MTAGNFVESTVMPACPYCEKLINADEVRCSYCGNDLSRVEKKNPYKFSRQGEYMVWMFCTAFAMLGHFGFLFVPRLPVLLTCIEVFSSTLIFRAIIWVLFQTDSLRGLMGKTLLVMLLGTLWLSLKYYLIAKLAFMWVRI